jgi:alginate O-acetyltransferase complex protein AlgJ
MQLKSSFSFEKIYPFIFIALLGWVLLAPLFLTGKEQAIDINTFDTNFFGRQQLIGIFTDLRIRIGDRVFSQVLIGKDGWLNLLSDENINTYQKFTPLGNQPAVQVGETLLQLKSYLKKRGIELVVVIVPNKETIYSDYVSDQLPIIGKKSDLDLLIKFLHDKKEKDLLLDLRPTLKEASVTEQVYYKTDTHWTYKGAYVAYNNILLRLQRPFPNLQLHPLSQFQYVSLGKQSMDLSRLLGSSSIVEERYMLNPDFEIKTVYSSLKLSDGRLIYFASNPDKSLPRALIYNDSFMAVLRPFLGEYFSNALFLPHSLEYNFFTWLDYEKPDVVIIEFVERDFLQIPIFIKDIPSQ